MVISGPFLPSVAERPERMVHFPTGMLSTILLISKPSVEICPPISIGLYLSMIFLIPMSAVTFPKPL